MKLDLTDELRGYSDLDSPKLWFNVPSTLVLLSAIGRNILPSNACSKHLYHFSSSTNTSHAP